MNIKLLAIECINNNMFQEAIELINILEEDGGVIGAPIGDGVGTANVLTPTGETFSSTGNTMPLNPQIGGGLFKPKGKMNTNKFPKPKKPKAGKTGYKGTAQDWMDKDVNKHVKKVTNKYVHLFGNSLGE